MEFSYYHDQGVGETDRFVPAPIAEVTIATTESVVKQPSEPVISKRTVHVKPIDLSRFGRKKQHYREVSEDIRGPDIKRPYLPRPIHGVNVDSDNGSSQASDARIVSGLLASSLAKGTVKNYELTIKRFEEFCLKSSLDFDTFNSETVLKWICHLERDKAPFSFVKNIKPALTFLEDNKKP